MKTRQKSITSRKPSAEAEAKIPLDTPEKVDLGRCPLDTALGFLSGAWTCKIMYNLRGEPTRFGDLRRNLGGVSAKVLAQRLKEMEHQGVVGRTVLPTSPPQVIYHLTDLGRSFAPVFEAMAKVGRLMEDKQKEASAHA